MEEYLQTLKEEGRLSSPGQMDKKGGTPSPTDKIKHESSGTGPRLDPEFHGDNSALEAKCAELERKILEGNS